MVWISLIWCAHGIQKSSSITRDCTPATLDRGQEILFEGWDLQRGDVIHCYIGLRVQVVISKMSGKENRLLLHGQFSSAREDH